MNTPLKNKLFAGAFFLCLAAALVSFWIFGLHHTRSWADAAEYNAFAVNLAAGHGYSMDGIHFSIFREPGYPFFLALIYIAFGAQNFLAVGIVQAILLGVLGYIVYRIFSEYGERGIGLIAGICIAALPSYGYYANEILTELLFTFCLGILFYLCVRIARVRADASWLLYGAVGFLCGYTTLVKVQFLFFLPFIIICQLLLLRPYPKGMVKKILLACLVFVVVVGSWMAYVHRQIGEFAITDGRQEVTLNERAVRAQLSYGQLTQYLEQWLWQSISGGQAGPMLAYDFRTLDAEYAQEATTTAEVAKIKQQNIQIILHNPGHYLYGNAIELIKLLYPEHDYSNSTNRYFRPIMYAIIYLFFAFGLYELWRKWAEKDMRMLSILSLLFIFYNYLVITPFDAIPRYNTPYLMFYMLVGFTGVVLFRKSRENRVRA